MPLLSDLLDINRGDVVSIVGAGGKTTMMYRICHELAGRGLTVISTTTTVIQRPTRRQSPSLLLESELPDLPTAASHALEANRHVTVVGSRWRADKLKGVSEATVETLSRLVDVVVIEADGARHNAIKAPAEHEPVVPALTTHFLSVAGLHALGRPLVAACHRPELAARVTGQGESEPVTADTIALLLGSTDAGLKGKPSNAKGWALLTHLSPDNEAQAREIAATLQGTCFTGVIALSLDRAVRLA